MQQAILARQDADDGAKIQKLQHCSVVYPPYFNFRRDVFDTFSCQLAALRVDTCNHNGAIVRNIDGGPRLFSKRTDHRPPFPYDVTYFLGVDSDLDDTGSMFRDILAPSRQRLLHDRENMYPSFPCLYQGSMQDLFGDPLNLDIHLQGSNAVFGTRHLEIHVAQVIFITQNITE